MSLNEIATILVLTGWVIYSPSMILRQFGKTEKLDKLPKFAQFLFNEIAAIIFIGGLVLFLVDVFTR